MDFSFIDIISLFFSAQILLTFAKLGDLFKMSQEELAKCVWVDSGILQVGIITSAFALWL